MNPLLMPFQQKMQQIMSAKLDQMMAGSRTSSSRKSFHQEMEQYFCDVRDGKIEVPEAMAEAMCLAAMQAVTAYMAKHEAMEEVIGECAATGELMTAQSEKHKKFKDVIDKMREAGSSNDVQRIIDENFTDLTQEEKQCLHQMAKPFSRKGNADALRVSVEAWEKIKKNAEAKLKE